MMNWLLKTFRLYFILSLSIIVFGCDSGDADIIPEPRDPRLKSIEYPQSESRIEHYYYGPNNELIEFIIGSSDRYQIEYLDDRAILYRRFRISSNSMTVKVDSLGYNQMGQLVKIFDVSYSAPISRTLKHEYFYNDSGRPIEKRSYLNEYIGEPEPISFTYVYKYYWNDDNIEREEWYSVGH